MGDSGLEEAQRVKIGGFATPLGTERFKERFEGRCAPGHFRLSQGLWFSSIGMGTYLGEPDDPTDSAYREAVKEAIRSGVNLIDSAINYRCQRSERVIGQALRELIQAGEVKREELILCTKGGYLPFDGDFPADPGGYFKRTYLESGLLAPDEIAQGCHAMTPKYLEDQLNRSLENLRLEAIDIYYLHNPETQLAEVDRREFLNRLKVAFAFLEEKVSEGKIRMYGTATWSGYRTSPDSKDYLSLQEILVKAREAGGAHHHFKVVQLPVNLAMPEAWIVANQGYGAGSLPFLEAALALRITVVASASLLQGQLAKFLPAQIQDLFPGLRPAQCSLQFVRSLPGIVTALVGMRSLSHVLENLELAKVSPAKEASLVQLYQAEG